MRALLNLAIITAAVIAAPALAQDTARAPFSGPRVEARVGYDRVGTDGFGHASGVTYGIGAGYDFAFGRSLVAGFEANANLSNSDLDFSGVRVKAKRDLDASVRLGTVLGHGLLYAKVGYANARVRATTTGFVDSTNLDGVRAGVGYEHALGRHTFLKAEYLYSNFENGVDRNQVVGGFGFRF